MTRLPLRKPRPPRLHRSAASRTIADELTWGGRKLSRAGKADFQRLALATWAVLAGQKAGAIWLNRLAPVPASDLVVRYRRSVTLQVAGAPFQSAVGIAAFRHLQLSVGPSVLIPRLETEDLVSHVLACCRSRNREGKWGVAADIGTGSGAIALALATEGEFERVIATDVSAAALAVARSNLHRVRPRSPVEVREGWLLEPLSRSECDVIVSNPPYLTTAEYRNLGPDVRDYEPRVAFDGGTDGLDLYRPILSAAGAHLRDGGLLALEIDSRRSAPLHALALAAGWSDARVVQDVFQRPRYLLATKTRG